MVCIECGGELTPQKKAFNCHSCEGKTAVILERLEEVISAPESDQHLWCMGMECPDPRLGWPCHLCTAFYIKTGRMMTEEDLRGDQNVD